MYSKELEELIDAVLADGVITEKEWAVMNKRAMAEGVDLDELEIVVNGRLAKKKAAVVPPPVPGLNNPQPPSVKPASIKYGVMNKCPKCGAVVEAGTVKCTECDYIFRGIEGNSSRQKLGMIIDEIDKREFKTGGLFGLLGGDIFEEERRDEARARAITNFPVPNTKDDLLEFIMFLQPMTEIGFLNQGDVGPRTTRAYKTKYKECINKAKLFFADDVHFKEILKDSKGGFFKK